MLEIVVIGFPYDNRKKKSGLIVPVCQLIEVANAPCLTCNESSGALLARSSSGCHVHTRGLANGKENQYRVD